MTVQSGINWPEFKFPPVNLPVIGAWQGYMTQTSALDKQVDGDHYKKLGEYQPYHVLNRWMTPEELKGFAKGSAIAYLAREADKGGRKDIEKAIHHLQLWLEVTK